MQDHVVATYVEDETCDRVYVWASGVETWYDREAGFWCSRRLRNPTEVAEAKAERDAFQEADEADEADVLSTFWRSVAAFLKTITPRETV